MRLGRAVAATLAFAPPLLAAMAASVRTERWRHDTRSVQSHGAVELDYRRRTWPPASPTLGVFVLYLAHARAVHGDVGHERVHRRRVHPRPPASAGQSALRAHRPRLLAPADRAGTSRRAINILAALCSAVVGGHVVPDHRARARRAGSPQRWQRIAGGALAALHRRHGVHRVEPVRREREGLHGLARRSSRIVSWLIGALVRRARRPQGRPHPRARSPTCSGSATRTTRPAFSPRRRSASPCSSRRPRTLLRWKLLLACAGGARARASRRSRRSRSAPRTSRRSTRASRRRARDGLEARLHLLAS